MIESPHKSFIPVETPKEKKQSLYLTFIFLIVSLLGPIAGIVDFVGVTEIRPGFWQSVILSYVFYSIFNLVDLSQFRYLKIN